MTIHDWNGTSSCVGAWSHFFWRMLGFSDISILSRSYQWKRIRAAHLKEKPECAVCGSTKNVVPHHIIPFSVDPSRELDPSNLISLCEGKTFNCHLFFGHLRNWSGYNPDVVQDARFWREKLKSCRVSESS